MYVIGEESRSNREAFDALEGAFGAVEFSSSEAAVVLQYALNVSELEASRLVRELIRTDAIKAA